MELLIVRHGLPVRVDDAEGGADPGLSDVGHEQARRLADWLRGDRIDAVFTSPMQRARETAVPLAQALGLEPIVDDDFAELDKGERFYIPIEELKASGDPRYELWANGGYEPKVDPQVFRKVVTVAVERVVDAHPGGRVVIVCHGGVINAYAGHVLSIGMDVPIFFLPMYTSINRFLCSSNGLRTVASLNEAGHLVGTRD